MSAALKLRAAQWIAHRLTWRKRLEGKIDTLIELGQQRIVQMSTLDDKITALTASVANLTTVEQSAVALINGIKAEIAAAVAAAQAAGATEAQLAELTNLQSSIDTQTQALAAAVAANTSGPTPATPAPPAPTA